MSQHDHDLALAIHHQIISPESVDAALDYWHEMLRQPERIERTARDLLWTLLACTSGAAIDAVLARRLSEAARTGPQEEPGYPGSLLPPKRGAR